MSGELYNLIMHSNPKFWSGNEGYVDFPKDRFLEYTEDHIKNYFQSLDQNVINELKTLPTLFAVEHENSDNESPFAYHHVAMAEITKAINEKDVKKYHFNVFRALLEKTANFLGYSHWKDCLKNSGHSDTFTKIIDHYSHDRLSDLEYQDLTDDDKKEFEAAFDFFEKKYFKQEAQNG